MKKNVLVTIGFLLLNLTLFAQEATHNFGLKGGINLGKYVPSNNPVDYDFNIGFYVGGLYKVKIDGSMNFQPELLYALHGSKVKQTIKTFDFSGNPLPFVAPYDFEYEIYESTISIPLMLKWYWYKKFYMESGPQLGFIIDRKITTSQQLLDGANNDFIVKDGDDFDFGVSLGFGFDISDNFTINIRSYSGLTKRDNDIKSFVLNLGMEYRL